MARRFLLPGLAAGLVLSTAAPALACGGLFCQNTPVDQAGEKILFATDGQHVTAHVQIQYQGAAKDFSWVVPVPTAPTLAVGSDLLFRELRRVTRPTFELDLQEEGCLYPPMAMADNAAGLPAPTSSSAVTVVSQDQVGPYDSAVIKSNDPAALKGWLRDNNYTIPAAIDPLLNPYVEGGYYFLALKLSKDKDAGDLQPIAFTYESTKPGVPIRLTGVAATPDMGVYVWVLGKERAVPENYRHAAINEARIDWLNGGSNYPQVVTEAMNEAGGQAFVTDFAGKSGAIAADTFDPARFKLDRLRTATEPITFARAVVDNGYFGEAGVSLDAAALTAFLKRYIPKPAGVEADDDTFYRNITAFEPQLAAAQTTVDAARAAAELETRVVKPFGEIKGLFERHPYLTALYTTMSPDEMTQDPMFVFNGQLGDVAAAHKARGLRVCGKDQYAWNVPTRITLGTGVQFWVRPNVGQDADATPIAMPAALRIEQLKAAGAASVITDNGAKIAKALGAIGAGAAVAIDPGGKPVAVPAALPSNVPGAARGSNLKPEGEPAAASGFGCAGCANPARIADGGDGRNEGATFALFALGLAGWRLSSRRPGRLRRR